MPEPGLRSPALLVAEAPMSMIDEMPFRRGMPTPDQVREHAEKHPCIDSRERHHGGNWIVIDDQSSFGCMPQFARLKIGDDADCDPTHGLNPKDFVGRVLIENGISFWQPLHLCRWAERSLYLPVSPRGLPL